MIKYISLLLLCSIAFADTPPPGTVKAKMFTGDGVTGLTATGTALNVNVSNSAGLTTVNQGNAGAQAWLTQVTNASFPVTGTFWQSVQPISASALPLPAGAATSALQTSGNASLTSIDSKTPALGQALAAASVPVVLTSAQLSALVPLTSISASLLTGANTIGAVNINGTVPVSGTVTATNPSVGTTGSAAPSSSTLVGGSDGTNLRALKTSAAGVLSVDGSAVTQPVSGTFFQATQPVSGTFWQATQPVSAASLPLPTGAATSAKQPAIGTAGTPSADVLTVQGAASMTALKVDGSAVTQPVSGTFWQATQPVSGTVTANAGTGTFAVSAASLPLPAGAATSALQSTMNTTLGSPFQAGGSIGNTTFGATQATAANLNATVVTTGGVTVAKDSSLTTINSTLGTPMQQTGGTVTANAGTGTFAVSAAALPLPAGAATSALQTTGNTSLNSIDTKTPAFGQTTMSASVPVTIASDQSTVGTTMPDSFITGQAAQTAVVNNIIPAAVSANATDAAGFRSASVQIVSTGTGGTFIFEGSNDNTNFQTIPVFSQLILTGTPIVAAITPTSSQLIYTFPVTVRYIRVRIATTITGGSIQAVTRLSQTGWTPAVFQVAQATAANLATTATIASGTVTTVSTVTSVASAALATNTNVADLASTAKTTTFTLTLTPAAGTLSQAFQINTSAVTGTTPTMDCSILESLDNGTTYSNTVYQFERITANLSAPLVSPLIRYTGNKLEWSCVIAGTTPSFTMTLNRMASQASAQIDRRFFDRTITVTSLNSTTAAFNIEGCSNISFGMANSTAATPATLDLQLSEDGTVFESQGTTFTPASNAAASIQGLPVSSKFARLIVTSAGVTETLSYAWIRCGGL